MKRFIDTEIMLKPWFRALEPRLKVFWIWCITRCDMSGFLIMDWDLASFAIGEKVTEKDLQRMGGNIQLLENNKLFVKDFVSFQYGKLGSSRVHDAVRKALDSNNIKYTEEGVCEVSPKGMDRVSKGYPKGMDRVSKDLSKPMQWVKDKDKDKGIIEEGIVKGGGKSTTIDFEVFWGKYERKGNKKAACAQWQKLGVEDRGRALESLEAYFLEKPERQYRKDAERYLRDRVFEDVLERRDNPSANLPGDDSFGDDPLGLRYVLPPLTDEIIAELGRPFPAAMRFEKEGTI